VVRGECVAECLGSERRSQQKRSYAPGHRRGCVPQPQSTIYSLDGRIRVAPRGGFVQCERLTGGCPGARRRDRRAGARARRAGCRGGSQCGGFVGKAVAVAIAGEQLVPRQHTTETHGFRRAAQRAREERNRQALAVSIDFTIASPQTLSDMPRIGTNIGRLQRPLGENLTPCTLRRPSRNSPARHFGDAVAGRLKKLQMQLLVTSADYVQGHTRTRTLTVKGLVHFTRPLKTSMTWDPLLKPEMKSRAATIVDGIIIPFYDVN
jgi:hypothetical protein